MSSRLPRVTGTDLVRALHREGWYDDHQRGSHLYLRHPTKPNRVTVPIHVGKIIRPDLLTRILKDANLTAEELRRLL